MKRIYAVQVNYLYGKTAYLPYSAGAVIANAFADDTVKSRCSFGGFVFTRTDPDTVAAGLDSPYMVVFSSYVWNYEYNMTLAEKIKARFPECLIVFGGHQISMNSGALLNERPFIDFLIHEEGEIPLCSLLKTLLDGGDLSLVPNLSYRGANSAVHTNETVGFERIDYPSPYLNGWFDDIVRDESYEYAAILETNRGCPFSCSFCDWGTLRGSMRLVSLDRVRAEIDWMSKHKIAHIYCADSNFGIYKRDEEIVDMLIESKKLTGYPEKFRVCFSKESNDFIFELNRKLNDAGLSKGATLSFQSLDPQTMKNVGRHNLSIQKYNTLISKYNREGIPTQTELIIALPGETYGSFVSGVCNLLRAGQHTSINIYNCEMFPNSRISSEQSVRDYEICSIKTPAAKNHCESQNDIEEYDRIICATSTMSKQDWIKANLFSCVVQAFHCLGLTQMYAIYLYYECGVSYEDFYSDFLSHCLTEKNSVCGKVMSDIESRLMSLLEEKGSWEYTNPLFGSTSWPFEEGVFLEIISRYSAFTIEISDYIASKYRIDSDVFSGLSEYQKNIVKVPGRDSADLMLDYDFYSYFRSVNQNQYQPLEKKKCSIKIDSSSCCDLSMADYARLIVWYGRKGGKNIYSGAEMEITYFD